MRLNERSPGLNPLDYWVWGTLKARVFQITVEKNQSALSNLPNRLQEVLDKSGHNEHLL